MLCNEMLFKSPALLNILCCMATIQNKNLLHCTLDATTLMVLFDDEAGNRKHYDSQFSWLALRWWVLTWVFAQGQQVKGGGGVAGGYSILGFAMQPTVSLACLTHAAAHYNQPSCHSAGPSALSLQHQFNQVSFSDRHTSRGKPWAQETCQSNVWHYPTDQTVTEITTERGLRRVFLYVWVSKSALQNTRLEPELLCKSFSHWLMIMSPA